MTQIIEDYSVAGKLLLGLNTVTLKATGGLQTASEISQQPRLWMETWNLISQKQVELRGFLHEAFSNQGLEVILTGAGTSAFIGNVLQGYFQKNTKKFTAAVATTDLLSHPDLYFNSKCMLMISFGRSGNSPESIAAVNLANMFCDKVFHLVITCNANGKLATMVNGKSAFLLLLPKEADDQSVAMTSSFTSMLLAGLLVSSIEKLQEQKKQVERLCEYGNILINEYAARFREVAQLDFDRAVFLGSGPMLGSARESDLKIQELTGGKVICKHDSFLGFRHGPKIVITPSTLIVFLFSNNDYVHQYEVDLVKDINAGDKGLFRMGIAESTEKKLGLDLDVNLSGNKEKIEEAFLPVCSVLPAQIIGFFKSIQLGLKPDNSAENGTITRVVQGVNIYPFLPDGNGKK